MGYFDVSAKLNINIDECMEDMMQRSYEQKFGNPPVINEKNVSLMDLKKNAQMEEENEGSDKEKCCIF